MCVLVAINIPYNVDSFELPLGYVYLHRCITGLLPPFLLRYLVLRDVTCQASVSFVIEFITKDNSFEFSKAQLPAALLLKTGGIFCVACLM